MENIAPLLQTCVPLGSDRLLSVHDVAEMMHTCIPTARRIMDESGCSVILHRKKYVLASSFFRYIQSMEAVS